MRAVGVILIVTGIILFVTGLMFRATGGDRAAGYFAYPGSFIVGIGVTLTVTG